MIMVKLELLRLRAMLLEEEPSEEERRALEEARKEIAWVLRYKSRRPHQRDRLSMFQVINHIISQRARKAIKRLSEHYKIRIIEYSYFYARIPHSSRIL